MGKKKVILSLIILFLLICMKPFSQNIYTKKIEWACEVCIKKVVYSDTCQLKEVFEKNKYISNHYTKSMTIDENCLFCRFIPVGSGLPIWSIEIYKQVDDQWRLVAEGEVVRPYLITVDYDSSRKTIVFSTIKAEYDSLTYKIKKMTKIENIGELSLSDL